MADYISREAAAQILRKEAANHYPTPFHVAVTAASTIFASRKDARLTAKMCGSTD